MSVSEKGRRLWRRRGAQSLGEELWGRGPERGTRAQGSLHSTTLRSCLAEGGGMSPPEQDSQGKGRSHSQNSGTSGGFSPAAPGAGKVGPVTDRCETKHRGAGSGRLVADESEKSGVGVGVTSGGEAPQYPFSFLAYHSQAPSVGLEAIGGNTASSSLPHSWRATGLAVCATNRALLLSPAETQTRSEPGCRDTPVTVTPRQGAEPKQTCPCFLHCPQRPPAP